MKTRTKRHLKVLRRMFINTMWSFGPDELQRQLLGLGVGRGETVLVHSSFDAFKGFQGKPSDVIAVLQAAVGIEGVLMMPTMTFSGTAVAYARSDPLFDAARTPSKMGLLTELFRRSPQVLRSVHPTHSVALWGRDAAVVASGHHLARTPCGVGTPFDALLKRNGKILLLGTDIGVLTFFHLLEETFETELPVAPFTQEVFHLRSKTMDGRILDSSCRLFEATVSRRRNLHKMVPYLKRDGAWREAKVGGLRVTVLSAAAVEQAVGQMIQQGVYCYD
ncbi:MAG: AAC(3) family N-acetyltransferase [Gammaproteobacteria bacterium]|uniref:AAC(3) family N-acetyltransferase n=1 Tax=Rhodoferax sp. TaxID=50421 RepID=UPI001DB4C6FA|nr:AAC(3) family N-acetyltransferase [Rhodoferax sp.]MBU3897503.1 AAC(3) family N-acetyltransferase [Gammaproteobacteria bacterium]MBU4018849.1 AAC(3) family N-acetyltransferase [Gammaproteobacteria bacterium]MBU4079804.1 AAC(3) family N-acetyltransferase [Gammaproteobacteria bacterium]MBU4115153.1 AAC(3) family N-acetyltransferase [Gammaproteobacteria bacterium]MBU4169760.1 AAC(3) family N-acetyltransferase [Gammaproteobacteria bacterium]